VGWGGVSCGSEGWGGRAYKTPMLMATITPTFSLRFMVRIQMTFQGTTARTMSMAPE
jgi:hypothetical protein